MMVIYMKKNEIYVKMLALSLPYIRNIQFLDKKKKEGICRVILKQS